MYNTGNPIPSAALEDMADNAQVFDNFVNSSSTTTPNRNGASVKTRAGFEADHDSQIATHENEHDAQMQSFEDDFYSRLAGMAFTRVGTFTGGYTLTDMRQTMLWEISQGGDGHEYGWSGSFPKVVSAGSTPATSGGIGAGAWSDKTDLMLREDLAANGGAGLVGTTGGDTVQAKLDAIDAVSSILSFANAIGTANAYVCRFTPTITTRSEGQVLRFRVAITNTGASTFNDGVGFVPLVGGAHSALQGGELVAGGDAWVQWNSSVGAGAYVLLYCSGAPLQVANGTKSQHAIALGQFVSTLAVNGAVKFPDGTMIVKGQISSTVSTTPNTIPVTFPVAFGVACDSVVAAFMAGIETGLLSQTCESQTTTGFTLRAKSSGNPGPITFCYIAIGRWK